jgi:hypothetical protein
MTFCDKCGTVIADGIPIEKMVLEKREYDLCPGCHQDVTSALQSKGRPVAEPVPTPAPLSLPSVFTPIAVPQTGQWGQYTPTLPYVQPYAPGFQITDVTWTTNGTPVAPGTLMSEALSNAVAGIGQAISASNAMYFAAKD